jgi:hypothetical protein
MSEGELVSVEDDRRNMKKVILTFGSIGMPDKRGIRRCQSVLFPDGAGSHAPMGIGEYSVGTWSYRNLVLRIAAWRGITGRCRYYSVGVRENIFGELEWGRGC